MEFVAGLLAGLLGIGGGIAGALVLYPSKKIEGAYDPRSDGKASSF